VQLAQAGWAYFAEAFREVEGSEIRDNDKKVTAQPISIVRPIVGIRGKICLYLFLRIQLTMKGKSKKNRSRVVP